MNKIKGINVYCEKHVGFINNDAKMESKMRIDDACEELIAKGYSLIDDTKNLFRRGNDFARVHRVNDWRMTREEKEKISDGDFILNHYGNRYFTSEAHTSKWSI